jgi:uncharacterized protein (DUF1697 family)
MSEHAAFLRGVNVGRHRRISSSDLLSHFERMGFRDVATFRTSGNVVFGGAGGSPDELAARVEAGLAASLGWEVEVFLRTAGEVRAIAEHQPFDARLVAASKGKLQVVMVHARPAATRLKQVLSLATEEDLLAFGERELYWLPSGGTVESQLDRAAIEKLLGSTTTRTKGTIEQLAAKFFAG